KTLQLQKRFTALVCLDTKYIAGKMMIVRSFIAGMKILAIDPCANPIEKISPQEKIDFAALVPYQLQTIIESDHSEQLDNINTIIIGGASLDIDIIKNLDVYACNVYATYGMN